MNNLTTIKNLNLKEMEQNSNKSLPTMEDREKAIADVKPCSRMEDRSWPLAVIFILLGIVSDALKVSLGLQATNWILLGIAALLAAVFFRMGRAIYWNFYPEK
jgi:hypothetical protein